MSFPIHCASCERPMEQQESFDQCTNASCDFFLVPVNEQEDAEDTGSYWNRLRRAEPARAGTEGSMKLSTRREVSCVMIGLNGATAFWCAVRGDTLGMAVNLFACVIHVCVLRWVQV